MSITNLPLHTVRIDRTSHCPACDSPVGRALVMLRRPDGHYDTLCEDCSIEIVDGAFDSLLARQLLACHFEL